MSSSFWLNRREHPRHVLVRRSGVLHIDGVDEPCVVVNISAGGMMARTYRPRVTGERVRVELAPGEAIEGSVLWTQDWSIGVAFDEMIDVEALLARKWVTEHGEDRRRSQRVTVSCPAALRVNTRFHKGRICDISGGGARFRGMKPLSKLGPAILTLPDLPPLRATIAWTRDNDCGLVFEEEIPHDAIWRWLQLREKGD
ncbi:MAG: PilZ domain-containing protein [Allosphingosinicella sp.]